MAKTGPSPRPARFGPRSIEITAKDRASRRAVIEGLPQHTEVFVADLPDQPPEVVLEAAAEIRSAGLEPVPHLVARNNASAHALDALLAELRRVARVRSVFLTGGDRAEPSGPFASALDLLGTGLLQRHGLRRLAFAGYPEGHPRIPAADLEEALRRKLAAAHAAGFETLLISQFAFDAAPVVALARRLRRLGLTVPLRVGTAGPADRHILSEFARDLGAGRSAERLARPASDPEGFSIERFTAALAEARAQEPALGLEGLHLFPFGPTEASVGWLRQPR